MKKQSWFIIIVIFVALGYWGTQYSGKISESKKASAPDLANSKSNEGSYWTCPMHPQIHSDKPGECPICHMKLVQVKAQGSPMVHSQENESRSAVVTTPEQLKLLGVQKVKVEKMDLNVSIPISGHLISPTSVAFQVYEADLRYIKTGQAFVGESSFIPETEIQGSISSIDSIIDPTSRTVRVTGQIKKGSHGLIAETTFRGDIEIQLKDVMAIPESSVLHSGAGDLVYRTQDDGSLIAQAVKLGQKSESYYEVLEGLSPGDAISSGPNFLIDSEAKIRGISEGSSGHANH